MDGSQATLARLTQVARHQKGICGYMLRFQAQLFIPIGMCAISIITMAVRVKTWRIGLICLKT
eukprot:4996329-Amphidinium_carterae.1